MVTCGFCGHEFEENRAQPACRACPLGADCGLIRCPECGYENPGVPRWIAFLKRKLGKKPTTSAQDDRRRVSLPMIGVPPALRASHTGGALASRAPGELVP
jgi:hypothetical protein